MDAQEENVAISNSGIKTIFVTFITIFCIVVDIAVVAGLFTCDTTPFYNNTIWCFGLFAALITIQFISTVMFLLAKSH